MSDITETDYESRMEEAEKVENTEEDRDMEDVEESEDDEEDFTDYEEPPHPLSIYDDPDLPTPEGPTFHLFKKLPIEIRLMIWRFAAPKTALITSSGRLLNLPSSSRRAKLVSYMFRKALIKVPALLRVNKESRYELLHRHGNKKKDHVTYRELKQKLPLAWGNIGLFGTVDAEDTYFITDPSAPPILRPEIRETLQHLAINMVHSNLFNLDNYPVHFKNLKTITLVVTCPVKKRPEIGGELDRRAMILESTKLQVEEFYEFRFWLKRLIKRKRVDEGPEGGMPLVKIRSMQQFLEDFE